MHSEKSPGSDGLLAEFYKTFWSEIAGPLLKALNNAYETCYLPITQKCRIIKLIPKKDSDLHLIKNWRPLPYYRKLKQIVKIRVNLSRVNFVEH